MSSIIIRILTRFRNVIKTYLYYILKNILSKINELSPNFTTTFYILSRAKQPLILKWRVCVFFFGLLGVSTRKVFVKVLRSLPKAYVSGGKLLSRGGLFEE